LRNFPYLLKSSIILYPIMIPLNFSESFLHHIIFESKSAIAHTILGQFTKWGSFPFKYSFLCLKLLWCNIDRIVNLIVNFRSGLTQKLNCD
jgi:hypothetical protein